MSREQIREERNRKIAGLLKYFRLIMAIFYLGMGISIAFLPLFADLSKNTRLAFGSLIMAYGLFRFYRQFKNNNHEQV